MDEAAFSAYDFNILSGFEPSEHSCLKSSSHLQVQNFTLNVLSPFLLTTDNNSSSEKEANTKPGKKPDSRRPDSFPHVSSRETHPRVIAQAKNVSRELAGSLTCSLTISYYPVYQQMLFVLRQFTSLQLLRSVLVLDLTLSWPLCPVPAVSPALHRQTSY